MRLPPEGSVPAAPEGTAAYYSILFCPEDRRPALTALYALERELQQITGHGEPSIAQIRLGWWGEELDRLIADEPRHPITRTLRQAGCVLEEGRRLQAMVHISQRLCSDGIRNTGEGVELDCQRSSALYGFAAGWLAAADPGAPARLGLAGDQLGAGVRLAQLAADGTDAPVGDLTGAAVTSLRQSLEAIPAHYRASQVPLIVLAALYLRQLRTPAETDKSTRGRRARDSLGMIAAAWLAARAASRGRLPAAAKETCR